MKQIVKSHRGGSGDKRVGSEEASLWTSNGGPPCSPPLCHPVAESRLASMGWLDSGARQRVAGAMFVGLQTSLLPEAQ